LRLLSADPESWQTKIFGFLGVGFICVLKHVRLNSFLLKWANRDWRSCRSSGKKIFREELPLIGVWPQPRGLNPTMELENHFTDDFCRRIVKVYLHNPADFVLRHISQIGSILYLFNIVLNTPLSEYVIIHFHQCILQ
jgi:hypothetical protein